MGFLIWWRTLSVTLPISSRVIPERPWLDVATNDALICVAGYFHAGNIRLTLFRYSMASSWARADIPLW